MSKQLRITGEAHLIDPQLMADGTVGGNAKFSLVGYTGRAIRQAWSRNPLVVDLAGMDTTSQTVAVMLGHQYDMDHAVGQADRVENSGTDLTVAGEVIGEGPEVAKAMQLARKGWKFQASIGADVGRIENIAAGETIEVNGRQFSGPISVVRASTLREVSIVLFGADAATSAAIAAEASDGGSPMADHANQTPDEAVKASAEDAAKVAAGSTSPAPVQLPGVTAGTPGDGTPSVDADAIAAKVLERLKAENLAAIRADRPTAPAAHVVAKPAETDEVLVASICLAGNLPGTEKQFSERTLEAADKRRHVGLMEVLLRAAKANGYDRDCYKVTDNNCPGVLRAAFATHNISNVLSAAYGKFLLEGYMAVEQVWPMLAGVRSVSDYKTVTGIRVNGGFEFERVGNGGELKSAEAGDQTRSIAAQLFGRISSITMMDIVNDDLGALTVVPQRLGRGAATRLNKSFWSEFEASNASYFAAATAAAGNALQISSLRTATSAYRKLTDPDGNPLAVTPAMLLVPPELEITAAELMSGSLLISGENSTRTNVNVLAGRYRVVSSAYLSSPSTWWLVANPGELPAMEVCFLNGQRQPVVQQAEADFDTLGIQVRGHFSFGVAKAESQGAYRMATA
jgi:hypothetical protein